MQSLTQLHTLYLSYNQISDYSPLKSLEQLKNLFLSNCGISEIPSVIFELASLEELDLSNKSYYKDIKKNNIQLIPKDIGRLKYLRTLNVEDNPIETPPPEIVKKGLAAIQNYWMDIERDDYDYISDEAKMLVIGEGGAGKTSLCQKILNPDYQLQPPSENISTEGIDVLEYYFPMGKKRQFRVNIWDFGGQEIYHSTHQFFLTKRSLYVLVTDNRKDDTDFRYWLNVQELLAGDSPVLIVQNERQGRIKDINKLEIRGRFENVRDFLNTNLKDNSGLPTIIKQIKRETQDLPHIGDQLPKSWIAIRQALEKRTENHISLKEYLQICQEHRIEKKKKALWISGYLHDLGTLLHFQDDPLLKRMLILKNEWGTDAVYKVLDSPIVKKNKGRFSFEDLPEIWKESTYDGKHLELIALMQKFKLCYPIPYQSSYIVPSRLPVESPPYVWETNKNLQLKYKYKFMPKGILTRFIVERHHNIKDQKLVWKTGVVLEKGGTLAEVKEIYDEEEILIKVHGAQRMHLRSVVMEAIDEINRTFTNLKVDKLVPCPCPSCLEVPKPHFYPLKELRNYKEHGVEEIRCAINPLHQVSVLGMISDLYPYPKMESDVDGHPLSSTPNVHVEVKPIINLPTTPTSSAAPNPTTALPPPKPQKWYQQWWFISITAGLGGGLLLAYFLHKYLSFYFIDTWLACGAIIFLISLRNNPKNRLYWAAMGCIGLFSVLNFLPQLDILVHITENMADGSWSKRLFQLGLQDSPLVNVALLVLAGVLFWMYWKDEREIR